jgi:chromosome segregation protein
LYLKALELVGFKSFAAKTRLAFEPGMTAIVGPNGCGKSNVSDAIRWALGEQSAKALRGAKMEDVIFNGTDTHKPLSMAEVSLTLADCESTLGTEFDEVTVTRRVLRSGEGQYFINKSPCRLKDIQRLFMDTGIGTNSYSLMEQGRIDLILSSRPEDRRAVFEEASGITKFKADKKEAIRKLEQTEANLLRLADIIREVKRRIISLQRQASKAKRYKALQDELRSFDTYLSRERLAILTSEITSLEQRVTDLQKQEDAARQEIVGTEQQAHELRTRVQQKENEIAQAMEAASRAAAERDRAKQTIQMNQDRIEEMQQLSERDHRDAAEAQQRLHTHQESLAALATDWTNAEQQRDAAETDLKASSERLKDLDANVQDIRNALNQLRNESVDLESRSARLQNELSDLDARERNSVTRRERLSAELAATKHAVEKFESRRSETEQHMDTLRQDVAQRHETVQTIADEKKQIKQQMNEQRHTLADLQKRVAAREAQAELYSQSDADDEALPPGARHLLAQENDAIAPRDRILGTLAEHIQAAPAYQKALEVALRAWLDAVVVQDDETLRTVIMALASADAGSARLVALAGTDPDHEPETDLPGIPLYEQVQVDEPFRPLAARLLHGIRVVDSLASAPHPLPAHVRLVTTTGLSLTSNGCGEIWMPGTDEANPLTRRHLLAQWQEEINALRTELARAEIALKESVDRDTALDQSLNEARAALEDIRRNLAVCEGEHQVKADEARQAHERMETVQYELNALVEQQAGSGERRTAITREIEAVRNRQGDVRHDVTTHNERIQQAEDERVRWLSDVTDKRVQLGERRQAVTRLMAQREDLQARITELESLIQERQQGLNSYQTRITELRNHIEQTQARLQPLDDEVARHQKNLETARQDRENNTVGLRHLDSDLHAKRSALDELRNHRSKADVQLAEQRMRRQSITDRLAQEYRLTPEELADIAEPEWENGEKPDRDQLETLIAEIRTKLESMGPVNLIAIEEYEELEERFTFLTEQQDDLVKAKTQLLDMIKRINNTTTEMFVRTFEQVNENFQETFKQLFGGGTAKLVLVDDDDVLDSGIEIIARPPGKKLQTVSLLSGGERTMTAVGLLFALYMVKPSPFCVLDELDAALDDANINRFVTMVQGFVKKSQFIVITHNRQTIEAADALYGVTMEKFGISKIMSVRFHKHEETDPDTAPKNDPQTALAEQTQT